MEIKKPKVIAIYSDKTKVAEKKSGSERRRGRKSETRYGHIKRQI